MAYIRERETGVWEVEVSTGVRDPVTGRYGKVSRIYRTGATRPHAGKKPPRTVQTYADELAADVRRGKGSGSASTVEHLFEEYIRHQEGRDRAPKTLLEYRRLATSINDARIGPAKGQRFGDLEIRRLTAAHIDELLLLLKERGLSDVTRHHYHALLSQALNQAVKWEWIDRNRAAAAEAPPLRAEERVPPTPAEVRLLLAQIIGTNPDLASYVFVAATTGCRRGELCGLRWRSVDLEMQSLIVEKAISDLPDRLGGPIEKDTKNHLKRPMALDDLTVAVLRVQLARALERCALVGVGLSPDAFVWSQEADHTVEWRPSRVTDAFMAARTKAGLPHVQLKDMRHFVSTQLLAAGVDIKTVAGRQGHDAVMTLRIYGHRIQPKDQQAARILGALLAEPEAPRQRRAIPRPGSPVKSLSAS